MSMAEEVAVFAHTNLDTRIAFNAHQDITAGALKRDIERVHFTCLPDTGEVLVNGLMVKRKSCLYYLPDSLPIKYAFPGMRRTWFLQVEVRNLNSFCIPCLHHDAVILSKPQELMICNSEGQTRCDSYKQNATTGSVIPENEVQNQVELRAESMQGSISKMSTQVISVTGIIDKYFSSFNGIDNFSSSSNSDVTSRDVRSEIEVQSKIRSRNCSNRKVNSLPRCTMRTPPRVLHAPSRVYSVRKSSGNRNGRSKVGKRLLVAARSFGVSITDRSPMLSFCKFNGRKLQEYKSQINGSIFSISDSDG